MKKVLILYTTAGIGHKKAAYTIKDAFFERGWNVLLADSLEYTSTFFKASYNKIYLTMINYFPTFWGLFYYLLDNPLFYFFARHVRRLINHLNSPKLADFILEKKPEVIIATHFMPVEIVSNLKKKGLKTTLISVITDYKSHMFWFADGVDYYVVGSDYTKENLIRRRIPDEKIKVYGIPCGKSFSEKKNLDGIKDTMGLSRDKSIIFLLGGGFGVGPIKKLVLYLDKLKEDFEAIVVCGYNNRLRTAIDRLAQSTKHKFKILGFVEYIDELMAISDILISKPGGITVTESLNAGLPIIVVSPIPGQEMRNYKFLASHGAALKINHLGEIVKVMGDVLRTDKLRTLKENIKKIRLLGSAEKIVDTLAQKRES